MCFHCAACALRNEFHREAAWYGIAFFHIHPSWVDTWEDDAIVKKLLRLTLDVHHTQRSWQTGVLKSTIEAKLNICFN